MTRSPLAIDLPAEAIRIVRWDDPIVEAIGHDPRSAYVERYWLALLGPSTTFLIRRIAEQLEACPDGFDLHLEDTARSIGLGLRGGQSGPFYRALSRTGQFHITRPAGAGQIAARTRLQTLTHHQLERLPARLQAEHAEWMEQTKAGATTEERRVRARRLALCLLELGEAVSAVEVQLHRWQIHPGLAHEALQWAQARRAAQPSAALIPPPRRPRPIYSPTGDAA